MLPLAPKVLEWGRANGPEGLRVEVQRQHAGVWRDWLHLDDADMQAVSHSRRAMSLNRGSSGASHKQTTRVVTSTQRVGLREW